MYYKDYMLRGRTEPSKVEVGSRDTVPVRLQTRPDLMSLTLISTWSSDNGTFKVHGWLQSIS